MNFDTPMYMLIYVITNQINGKSYVGKTIQTLKRRWNAHKRNAHNGAPYHLYRAMRKHGIDNFNIRVVEECDDLDTLNRLEMEWISRLETASAKHGYNMTHGGDGLVCTEEVREKIRAKAIGRKLTPEAAAALRLLHVGKIVSKDTRLKIAAHWDDTRKQRQAEIARRVNAIENAKLNDYFCVDCGRRFEQVTKGVFGGHRKACLHWSKKAEEVEKATGKSLEQILEEYMQPEI